MVSNCENWVSGVCNVSFGSVMMLAVFLENTTWDEDSRLFQDGRESMYSPRTSTFRVAVPCATDHLPLQLVLRQCRSAVSRVLEVVIESATSVSAHPREILAD